MSDSLSLSDVEALARDCLVRAGVPAHGARAAASEIAAAETRGARAHGLDALLRDLRLIRYGILDAAAEPKQSEPQPGVLLLDACSGLAAGALAGALPAFQERVDAQGVALLRLERASPPGAMFSVLAQLRDAGFAATGHAAADSDAMAMAEVAGVANVERLSADIAVLEVERRKGRQPADSPFADAVHHRALIVATARDSAGALWPEVCGGMETHARLAERIVVEGDLLEQIINA